MARGKVQGYVDRGGTSVSTAGFVSTTSVDGSFPSATVSVFNAGTQVLSTIYSTLGGVAKANPFTADANAFYFFWTDQALIDLTFSGSTIPAPFTLSGVMGAQATIVAANNVSLLATAGDGSSGNPWTGWETALNALPANARNYFPTGTYTQATRIDAKTGWTLEGDGPLSSIIKTALNTAIVLADLGGTCGVGTHSPLSDPGCIISSTNVRDLQIKSTNALATGSGIILVGNQNSAIERIRIDGFRFGISLINAIRTTITRSAILNAARIGIWIVGNGDYNVVNADLDFSAWAGGGTNVITISDNSITSTLLNIALEGGQSDSNYSHLVTGNSLLGGGNGIWLAETARATITDNHFEGFTASNIKFSNQTVHQFLNGLGTVGSSGTVRVANNWISARPTIPPITAGIGGSDTLTVFRLTVDSNNIAQQAVATPSIIVGADRIWGELIALNTRTGSNAALYDTAPARFIDLGTDTTGNINTSVSLSFAVAGAGVKIKEGSAVSRMGVATLNGGTPAQALVGNSSVTANTRFFLTKQTVGITGNTFIASVTPGAGFTIQSSAAADTATVAWLLIEAAP